MAIFSGPEIPNDGLVFNLDAVNPKNYALNAVEVLVVAGGGSGGVDNGAGGGGGGLIYNKNFSVTPGTALTVTIGAGGAARLGTSDDGPGNNGGNSVFGALTAIGGGGGSGWTNTTLPPGTVTYSGGSGAGQSASTSAGNSLGVGSATSGQGFPGGAAVPAYAGGGGGAGGPGGAASSGFAGNGGPGAYSSISGTNQLYAAGGAGGWDIANGYTSAVPSTQNGTVKKTTQTAEDACPANTGHGGNGSNHNNQNSGAGGSGIVIVRYPGPQRAIGGTVTKVGSDVVHTFTATGSSTFTPLSNSSPGLADLTNNRYVTLNNAPTRNADGSLGFNGSNQSLTIPTISLGNGNVEWTATAWVRTSTAATTLGSGSILSNANGGPVYSVMCVNNGKICYWTYQSGAWAQKLGVKTVNDNVWHLLTWVNFSNTTMKLYVDGVFDADVANSTSGNNNPIDMLGASWSAFFSGSIGAVQIYTRALSATEILNAFNASRDRYGI